MANAQLGNDVRDALARAGAALVGFADLRTLWARPENADGARDVHGAYADFTVGVSVAVPLPPHIVSAIRKAPTPEYAQTYRELNAQLDAIVAAGERLLVERGHHALALTKSRVGATRLSRFETLLPYKTVARMAGLGWIGKSCLLVTPQFGPAVRISTILTDAPLPCAKPVDESRCGACAQCAKACPGGAIKGVLWEVGTTRASMLDLEACTEHMEGVSRGIEEDLICGACIAACPYARRYVRAATA